MLSDRLPGSGGRGVVRGGSGGVCAKAELADGGLLRSAGRGDYAGGGFGEAQGEGCDGAVAGVFDGGAGEVRGGGAGGEESCGEGGGVAYDWVAFGYVVEAEGVSGGGGGDVGEECVSGFCESGGVFEDAGVLGDAEVCGC